MYNFRFLYPFLFFLLSCSSHENIDNRMSKLENLPYVIIEVSDKIQNQYLDVSMRISDTTFIYFDGNGTGLTDFAPKFFINDSIKHGYPKGKVNSKIHLDSLKKKSNTEVELPYKVTIPHPRSGDITLFGYVKVFLNLEDSTAMVDPSHKNIWTKQ